MRLAAEFYIEMPLALPDQRGRSFVKRVDGLVDGKAQFVITLGQQGAAAGVFDVLRRESNLVGLFDDVPDAVDGIKRGFYRGERRAN